MRDALDRGMLRRSDGGRVRALGLLLVCGSAIACGGGEAVDTGDTDPAPKGACGEVTRHDLVLTGVVHHDGVPVQGANVTLEERAWHADGKVFGTAVTDASGAYVLDVDDVVSVQDCWGSALAYYLVGVRGDARGEMGVNGPLYHGIKNADWDIEIRFPVEIAD